MMRIFLMAVGLFGTANASLSIRSISPESGTIIPADTEVTLTCTTTLPWYLCIWEGPGGIACQCQAEGTGGVSALCQGYPKLSLTGGGNVCSATISGISQEDAGNWRCVLVDSEQFTSVSRVTELEVGAEAIVSWVGVGSRLNLEEEENMELECESVGGYPEPVITMEGSDNLDIGRQTSDMSQNGFLYDVRNTAAYTGSLDDHDNELICISSQYSKSGELLYTSQTGLGLKISALEDGYALAIPVGGIVGIILAIIIIFLLCAILACFLLKNRREKEKKGGNIEDNEIIIASNADGANVPVEHSVNVTSEETNQKNYEANINQFYYASHEKEKLLGSSNSKMSENLEHEVYLGTVGRRGSSTSSSSSSSDEDLKSKNNETSVTNVNITNIHNSSSSSFTKEDSTFMYNGTLYKEEVFEDQLKEENSKFVPVIGKYKIGKWKKNMTDIPEERASQIRESKNREEAEFQMMQMTIIEENERREKEKERIQFQLMQTRIREEEEKKKKQEEEYKRKLQREENERKRREEEETIRMRIFEEERKRQHQEEVKRAKKEEEEYRKKQAQEELIRIKVVQEREQKRRWEEQKRNQQEEKERKRKETEEFKRIQQQILAEKERKHREQEEENRIQQRLLEERNQNRTEMERKKLEENHKVQFVESLLVSSNKDVQIISSSGSDRSKRTYQDEHYYIGDSEYAEVVGDHVQGRYKDDLGYFEEKSKEKVSVHPKVWTLEEIYYEEFQSNENYTESQNQKQKPILPESEEDDQSKHEYIQNWISTENLQEFSPSTTKSNPDSPEPKFSFGQELDRSDESCIVDVEVTKKNSGMQNPSSTERNFVTSNNASNVLSQSISQKVEVENLGDKSLKDSGSTSLKTTATSNEVNMIREKYNFKTTRTETTTFQTESTETKHREEENIDRKNYVESAIAHEKHKRSKQTDNSSSDMKRWKKHESKDVVKQSPNSDDDKTEKAQIYKITQQEIIFYLKNKDGVIKIVHRPLVQKNSPPALQRSTNQASFNRHKSQPNLHSTHILRHMDDYVGEAGDLASEPDYEEVAEGHSQHLHMDNVGLLQQSLSFKQFYGLGRVEGSSGSIFDCQMNCFNDNPASEKTIVV